MPSSLQVRTLSDIRASSDKSASHFDVRESCKYLSMPPTLIYSLQVFPPHSVIVCTYLNFPFSKRNSCESAAIICAHSQSTITPIAPQLKHHITIWHQKNRKGGKTHHMFPNTKDTHTPHLNVNHIPPMRIPRLTMITRDPRLTTIIRAALARIRAPFKTCTRCAPGHLLVRMRVVPHTEVRIARCLNDLAFIPARLGDYGPRLLLDVIKRLCGVEEPRARRGGDGIDGIYLACGIVVPDLRADDIGPGCGDELGVCGAGHEVGVCAAVVEFERLVDNAFHVGDDFVVFRVGPVAGEDGLEGFN